MEAAPGSIREKLAKPRSASGRKPHIRIQLAIRWRVVENDSTPQIDRVAEQWRPKMVEKKGKMFNPT